MKSQCSCRAAPSPLGNGEPLKSRAAPAPLCSSQGQGRPQNGAGLHDGHALPRWPLQCAGGLVFIMRYHVLPWRGAGARDIVVDGCAACRWTTQ
jgi:hypothetical protein